MLSHWKTRKALQNWYKDSRPEWIDKINSNGYLEPYEILKFGNVGCIARTSNPKIVMKITDKEEEAQILEYLKDNPCEGFANVYEVLQIWDGQTKIWFIWREYFDIVGEEAFQEVAKNNSLEPKNFQDKLLKMIKTYENNVLDDPIPFIEKMKKQKGFDKAAQSIMELTSRGLIISDLRLGNIGTNIGSGDLYVFDSMINTSSYLPEDYDDDLDFQNESYDPLDIWT